MALGDVISSVLDVTGRPDKETYARSSVTSLVRMLAGLRDHPLALVDAPQTVSKSLLLHTIVAPADLREVAYIRPTPFNAFLTRIDPRKAMHNGLPVVNCYYRRGTDIIVNLQQGHQTDTLVFGYYAHPTTLVADTDTNWVLDDYQDVLIDLLCAKVFRVTGDLSSAGALESSTVVRIQQIIDSAS